ncbi:DUF2520 domain-containing protein [Flavobacteriaceae bacterium]|nr:DUF2520 domain-containing protein [Flavobacteriaceae bacterium]
MISVVILGSGNVALQLIRAFLKIDTINLKQVFTRNQEDINTLKDSINTTNDISLLKQADVTIIAVSDDAISSISSHIKNSFVVHTSGSVDMKSLNNIGRKGVFYPLQSFSKKKKVDFKNIPICLESETSEDLLKLEKLVSLLQSKSYILSSHQRKKIHVAAVFANNFSNHMYTIANEICEKYNIPFDILHPLIEETSNKIKNLTPEKAQTGPAKRNDAETIENHLNLLSEKQQEIYLKITQSIQEYGKKL